MRADQHKRYLLLDRDGTLIEEAEYPSRPEQVVLVRGAAEALRRAAELGWGAIVISNQSGVGRGYFSLEDLERVQARVDDLLAEQGARLDGAYFCPHAPNEGCDCRKPKTWLVLQAANDLQFDPSTCIVVGDKSADLQLGRNIGAVTCLVRTGYGHDTERLHLPLADHVIDSLADLPDLLRNEA